MPRPLLLLYSLNDKTFLCINPTCIATPVSACTLTPPETFWLPQVYMAIVSDTLLVGNLGTSLISYHIIGPTVQVAAQLRAG